MPLQSYIDRMATPILLLDSNNTVVGMNLKACEMLGEKSTQTIRQPFGRVFDCVYSNHQEGCGRSIHCSGCEIRKSVTTTFDTGEPRTQVPATLSIQSADRLSDAVLTISTVRRDGLVLLRIDNRTSCGSPP